MNYIGDLRKIVGHDLIMTVGCGLLLENEKGELLLQRRSDNGQWCIPGGALEPHETYVEAVQREVFEEVGIRVTKPELFGLYSGEDRVITYPNQDVVYFLSVIFRAHTYEGTIALFVFLLRLFVLLTCELLTYNSLYIPSCYLLKKLVHEQNDADVH